MPIFDWRCVECGHIWEETVKIDKIPDKCPDEDKHKPIIIPEDEELQAEHEPYRIKKLPALFANFKSNWSKWRTLS